MKSNIVLIGFSGSGKTTLCKALAAKLNRGFVDTDAMAEKTAGKPISFIFRDHGEPYFRQLEKNETIKASAMSNVVISTGGGVVLDPENMEYLRRSGFIVWLQVSSQVIYERISTDEKRPLIYSQNPMENIMAMLEEREPLYRQYSDTVLDTSSMTITECVEALFNMYGHQGGLA